MKPKHKFYFLMALFQIFLVGVVFFTVNGVISIVNVAAQNNNTSSANVSALAFSAAISVSAATLGSAWAIRTVGTAAISSLTEREESFFKAFLVTALAEALAIYGLIIAILLWTKIP